MLAEQHRKPRHPAQRLLQSHGTAAERRQQQQQPMTPRLGMRELRQEARRETAAAPVPVYYTSRPAGAMAPAVVTRNAAIATPPRVSRPAPPLEPEPEPEQAVPAPLAAEWAGARSSGPPTGGGGSGASGGSGRMQQRRTAPRDAGGYVMGGLDGVRRRIADELVMMERECGRLAEWDHARLEIHRNSFNRLLGSFKTYAPLIAKIKSVFDHAIDVRLRKVAQTKPKEVMLDAISGDGFDLNLQSIHDTFNRQTKGDRTTLAKLQQETAFISGKVDKKQAKLDKILAIEKEIKASMQQLDDWQHTLIQSMRSWEKGLQELHHQADTNDNSVWKKNQDIAKASDKISNGEINVTRKVGPGGDLDEKKKELKKLVDGILKLHSDIQVRTADVRKTDKNVKEAKSKLRKMDSELATQKDRAVNRQSAVTPLPDWDEVKVSLEKVMNLDISKPRDSGPERRHAKHAPSADIVSSLMQQIAKLGADIVEAKQDVLQEEMAKLEAEEEKEEEEGAREAPEEGQDKTKWLVCHGRGDNVPAYLRATGRVKNKNFKRQAVIAFLADYWNAKDATKRTRAQSTADFLGSYIRNKYGTGRTAVEWTYNIMYALKLYAADPDCETFNCILHAELPEDAHYGQQTMVDRLLVEWKKADKQNHGGRMWGTLDRSEFTETLRRQFPLKSDDDLKALRRAVATDQPLPDIRYGTLLDKNPDTGLQGKFLETLREQFISDVQQTFPKVEAAIRKATLEENERKQTIVKIEDHQTYPYLQLLKNVPFFSHCELSDDELKALILEMDITEYHDTDVIISEGSPALHAFVLEEGFAFVTKEGLSQDLNCNYQVGDFFGELGLKQSDTRAASVIAKAGRRGVCRCIRMSADVFNKVRMAASQNEALLHQRQMQYFMATKMASAGTRKGEEKGEGHSLVTSIKCIREGLMRYDPDMPDKEVNRLLKLGCGTGGLASDDEGAVSPRSGGASPRATTDGDVTSGAMFDDEMMVTVAEFMANIRKTVIKRYAKPTQLTNAEKRSQFLRNISDSEREKITMCFNELDDSGDGTLDQEEIEGLLKRIYGMEPTKKQMAQLMLEMDSDGNGVIDLDEFISAMATVKEVRMAGDIFKWRQTFDQYDEDQSGELSGDELKKMTEELWDMGSHSLELMQFMIEEADLDGDGQISWPEFCQMMQRMMDADEKKLEMKRQRTIIAAQGKDEVLTQQGAQKALDRNTGAAKGMTWDIDLGVNNDRAARNALWKKIDYNNSNSATYGEIQTGLLAAYPRLEELIKAKVKNGSRIIMRAFMAADVASKSPEQAGSVGLGLPDLARMSSTTSISHNSGEMGDGLITRDEFPRFLIYVEFFANLWEHFSVLDADHNGKLDRKEFDSAFKAILPDQKLAKVDGEWQLQQGKGEGEEEERDLAAFLEEQFAAGDGDGSGYLSFDEFCAWIAAYHHELARDKTNPGMS